MAKNEMIIVGGGLAGLSVGCYAQMNGWSTRIIEHNAEAGGCCTVWRRDDYLVDGCIHWLMGGAEDGMFRSLYEELGVIRDVELHTIDLFHRYEDPEEEHVVELTRDLDRYRRDLLRLSPEDSEEIDRLLEAADRTRNLPRMLDRPQELTTFVDRVRMLWEMRSLAGTVLHFRGSLGDYCNEHLVGQRLRDYLCTALDPRMPVIFLPVLLQHVRDGQMSRPRGGSGNFRDAIVKRYRELGGEMTLSTTVEEILVEDDRAVGVGLADGTQMGADLVISTASAHETMLRLLGGRHLDRSTRQRLDEWPLFDPIVLLSAGVAMSLDDVPSSLIVKQSEPLVVGDKSSDSLYLRVYNDDPAFAPSGHCVVQTMVPTTWDAWAELGDDYEAEKERTTETILARIEQRIPGVRRSLRTVDLATPLSFWRFVRSWRGAYEGWLPTPETFRSHVSKTVPGLQALYLAGQWVEPGGGVPAVLSSGRQLVQLLCERTGRTFQAKAPT